MRELPGSRRERFAYDDDGRVVRMASSMGVEQRYLDDDAQRITRIELDLTGNDFADASATTIDYADGTVFGFDLAPRALGGLFTMTGRAKTAPGAADVFRDLAPFS